MTTQSFHRILERKLQAIIECGIKLTNVPFGQVLLVENDYLVIRATIPRSHKNRVKSVHLRIIDSIAGCAIQKKESVLVSINRDARYKKMLTAEMKSEFAIPIQNAEKRVIGVMCFESPENNSFTEIDRKLLENLAHVSAIVLQQYEAVGST